MTLLLSKRVPLGYCYALVDFNLARDDLSYAMDVAETHTIFKDAGRATDLLIEEIKDLTEDEGAPDEENLRAAKRLFEDAVELDKDDHGNPRWSGEIDDFGFKIYPVYMEEDNVKI